MPETADTVFLGGHTLLPGGAEPAGVAVRAGRIVAIAPDGELADLTAPGTEIVDLAGGLLLPGFQDSHVHPVMAGMAMLQCELHDTSSAAECLDIVAAYAEANPDLDWIVGGGWSMEFFAGGTPTR